MRKPQSLPSEDAAGLPASSFGPTKTRRPKKVSCYGEAAGQGQSTHGG